MKRKNLTKKSMLTAIAALSTCSVLMATTVYADTLYDVISTDGNDGSSLTIDVNTGTVDTGFSDTHPGLGSLAGSGRNLSLTGGYTPGNVLFDINASYEGGSGTSYAGGVTIGDGQTLSLEKFQILNFVNDWFAKTTRTDEDNFGTLTLKDVSLGASSIYNNGVLNLLGTVTNLEVTDEVTPENRTGVINIGTDADHTGAVTVTGALKGASLTVNRGSSLTVNAGLLSGINGDLDSDGTINLSGDPLTKTIGSVTAASGTVNITSDLTIDNDADIDAKILDIDANTITVAGGSDTKITVTHGINGTGTINGGKIEVDQRMDAFATETNLATATLSDAASVTLITRGNNSNITVDGSKISLADPTGAILVYDYDGTSGITLVGGDNANNISGYNFGVNIGNTWGHVTIGDSITNTGTLTVKGLTINEEDTNGVDLNFTTNADKLAIGDGGIINKGTMTLTGGTLSSNVGYYDNGDNFVSIRDEGAIVLTDNAAIGGFGTTVSAHSLTLNGNTLTIGEDTWGISVRTIGNNGTFAAETNGRGYVSLGETSLSEEQDFTGITFGSSEQKLEKVCFDGTTKADATKIFTTDANEVFDGTLTLVGATNSNAFTSTSSNNGIVIASTMENSGAISTNNLTINAEDAGENPITFTTDANLLQTAYAVDNDGTLQLTGNATTGVLGQDITGDGTTQISGTINATAVSIGQDISIDDEKSLSITAAGIGGDVTGGTNYTGSLILSGDTTTGALAEDTQISGVRVEIQAGSTVSADVSNFGENTALTNSGTFNLDGQISGLTIFGTGGTTVLSESQTIAADTTIGGTLDITGYDLNFQDTDLSNAEPAYVYQTNPTTYQTLTVGNLVTDSSDLKIDVNTLVTGGKATNNDKIVITSGANNAGTLNLSSINVTNYTDPEGGAIGEYADFIQVVDGTMGNLTLSVDNIATITSDGYRYTFTNGTTNGFVNANIENSAATLDQWVTGYNDGKLTGRLDDNIQVATFSLVDNLSVTADELNESGYSYGTDPIDVAAGTTYRDTDPSTSALNLYLNGFDLTAADARDGITVAENYTLNVAGTPASVLDDTNSVVSGFNTAFINNGTLNLTDVTLTNNTLDIANGGAIVFDGVNSVDTIDGAGSVTVANGALTVTTNIAQTALTVDSGAEFTADVDAISVDSGTDAADIIVNGNAYLSATSDMDGEFELGSSIDGTGTVNLSSTNTPGMTIGDDVTTTAINVGYTKDSTDYTADVTVNEGNTFGAENGSINVAEGSTLTMESAANLGTDTTNAGTLTLNAGTLSVDVTGATGETVIDGAVTLAENNSITQNKITINDSKSLTANVKGVKSGVVVGDEGELNIHGSNADEADNVLSNNITNAANAEGVTTFRGDVVVDADVTTSQINLADTPYAFVTVKEGKNFGDNNSTAEDAISLTGGTTLAMESASDLKAAVTNEFGSTVYLEGGTGSDPAELTKNITGGGETVFKGDIDVDAAVTTDGIYVGYNLDDIGSEAAADVVVAAGNDFGGSDDEALIKVSTLAKLTVGSADDVQTDIANGGELYLNGEDQAELIHDITATAEGNGETYIIGAVKLNDNNTIANRVEVKAGGDFEASINNLNDHNGVIGTEDLVVDGDLVLTTTDDPYDLLVNINHSGSATENGETYFDGNFTSDKTLHTNVMAYDDFTNKEGGLITGTVVNGRLVLDPETTSIVVEGGTFINNGTIQKSEFANADNQERVVNFTDFENNSSIETDKVTNCGDFDNNEGATITGSVENSDIGYDSGASFINHGGATINGKVINEGENANFDNEENATINGNVTNSEGIFENNGTVYGYTDNEDGGNFTNNGVVISNDYDSYNDEDSTYTNNGEFYSGIDNDGSFTNNNLIDTTGTEMDYVDNYGDFQNAENAQIMTAELYNDDEFTNNGAVVADTVENEWNFYNQGDIVADTVTNTGWFFNGVDPQSYDAGDATYDVYGESNNDATIIGDVVNDEGRFYNAGLIAGNVSLVGDMWDYEEGAIIGEEIYPYSQFRLLDGGVVTGDVTGDGAIILDRGDGIILGDVDVEAVAMGDPYAADKPQTVQDSSYNPGTLMVGGSFNTNTFFTAGGTLDLANDEALPSNLGATILTADSNMLVDADISNKVIDNFHGTYNSTDSDPEAKIYIDDISVVNDTKKAGNIKLDLFGGDEASRKELKDYFALGFDDDFEVNPIFKYSAGYDSATGILTINKRFNSAVLVAPVAQEVAYLTQLQSYDQAFANMDSYMIMPFSQRQALKHRNQYAAADADYVYDTTMTNAHDYDYKAAWTRPYSTFEKVGLKHGPKVSNVSYGSFFGVDSELYDIGNGWDGMISLYAAYNGSHQKFHGNSIYQNGGTLGLTGVAYKGNFFTGLTVNVSDSFADASTMYGGEDFNMLMAGVASKTGYNFEFADGKFIVQPSLTASYTFANTFDYTNGAGVRIKSDPLNAVTIEPGLKFVGNLENGWQPYAGISLVYPILDKTDFHANDVGLPGMGVKPYIKYGVGVKKTWGDSFTGFLQAFFTGVGRNGVGLQAGFRWTIGK